MRSPAGCAATTGLDLARQLALHEWRSKGLCWMLDVGRVYHALTELAGGPPCG